MKITPEYFSKFRIPAPPAALRRFKLGLGLAAGMLSIAGSVLAQNQVFFEDWETDHGTDGTYVTNTIAGATPNNINNAISMAANSAALFFDYTTVGVPVSPHTPPGGGTHALKLCCNLTTGNVFPTGISISPVGFHITDNFVMHFDAWFNFDGPMPGGGSGSTEIGGAGYGTAGTAPQVAGVADCVYIGGSTDGNSSSTTNGSDFRVYSSAHTISYQGGAHIIGSSGTDSAVLGDPTTPFVYSGFGGGRGAGNLYFANNFPSQTAPDAQEALYPQQTNSNGTNPGHGGATRAGALSFKWHDVQLQKVANVITYSIDGILIATVDVVDAGALGGDNILFNMYDINNGGDTQATATNLLFYLVDNVRITNFANVVSVSNVTATIAEGDPTPGVFTVTRTASGTTLAVNYTMSGSASNGVDYTGLDGQPLSGTVTFAQNATSTNISVIAVDDSIPETSESITLNINPSADYTGAGNATIRILDNDPAQLTITNLDTQMFKRTNDFARFQINRLGSLTNALPVSLAFSGTATYGVDFYTNVSLTFAPGSSSTNISIFPIEDTTYKGNLTVTATVLASSSNTVGMPSSATVNIIAAQGPPEVVLFSDNFNDPSSSANWQVFEADNDGISDSTVLFGFDYSGLKIPPSPHGGGDTHGLILTVNKNDADAAAAALNLYPIGQSFSGNYALRADMWLNVITPTTVTTEYALAGIDHSGTKTNWFRSGGVPAGWAFDGIFYTIESDAQAVPNFQAYSGPTVDPANPTALTAGVASSTLTGAFKSPPWTVAGSPAGTSANTTTAGPPPWSEVEVSQIGNIVTLRINNTPILSVTNTPTGFTNGNVMIGYEDAFDSIGDNNSYVVFDNVRVVRINGLTITSVVDLGSSFQVDFTFGLNDSPSGFALQSASVATGPYTDSVGTIVQITPGTYRATITKSGSAQFFRIRHN